MPPRKSKTPAPTKRSKVSAPVRAKPSKASAPTPIMPLKAEVNKQLSLRTEDVPIVLYDSNQRLIAGIKMEELRVTEAGLLITGWTLGFSRVSLLCNMERVTTEVRRVPRMDVLQTFNVTSDFDPGFELILANCKSGNYALRWFIERHNKVESVDFLLDVNVPEVHSSLSIAMMEQLPVLDSERPGKAPINSACEIECAVPITDGIVLIGWLNDSVSSSATLYIQKSKSQNVSYQLQGPQSIKTLERVYRPDICSRLNIPRGEYPSLGLIAWLPFNAAGLDTLTMSFDKSFKNSVKVAVLPPSNTDADFDSLLEHSGHALLKMALLHDDYEFLSFLEDRGFKSLHENTTSIAAIDHAYVIGNRALLLHGWVACKTSDLKDVSVVSQMVTLPLVLQRFQRPDLFGGFPSLNGESLGFVCLITDPDFVSLEPKKIKIRTAKESRTLMVMPQPIDLDGVFFLMNSVPGLLEPTRILITHSAAMQSLPRFSDRLKHFLHGYFTNRFNEIPAGTYNEKATVAAVDKVYALDDSGLLIFGWHFEPEKKPLMITVHDPHGNVVEVTHRLFPFLRPDVAQSLRAKFSEINDMCGFVCHAELPSKAGEPRALRFLFEENNEVWVKLATIKTTLNSLQLIKEVLGFVPSPDRIRSEHYKMFDMALGKPIESIHQARKLPKLDTTEKQFGVAPQSPMISVIVPLYGRYDFMRHQLAHFVNDPDFDQVDLLYIVDDPAIVEETVQSAAYCHSLFGKPFRVLSYAANLGFSGANNVGVAHSKGDIVLLLNSDVLPQRPGWLTVLYSALLQQPNAGAVGPLLEFGDGSIQHAGMQPKRDPKFPGFLLNTHGSKGLNWTKGELPLKVPMLTAACLMLRKADYLAVGGLDEGYIIGDFEDSDLCLKLAKEGKLMWLVPCAKLWHLERQSQNMNNVSGVRELLTLFNGWRFSKKILNGSIANPEVSE